MSTEDTQEASIADTEAAIRAEYADEGVEPEVVETAPPAAAAPVAAAPAPAAAPAAEPTPDMASVIAGMVRREAAAAAEEQARRAAAPPEQPRYRDTLSREELYHNPVAALRSAGLAPEHLAQYLVAELAPQASTPEARARLQMAPELHAMRENTSRELGSMRQELESMRAQERARAYEQSLHTFSTGVSSDQFPLIGRFAKEDPDGLAQELLEVAQEDARMKYLRGESGQPLDATEAARRLEARYAGYQRRMGAQTPPATSTAPAGSTKSSAKPGPAATIASLSGAPPARPAGKTLEDLEREIYAESIALMNSPQ